MLCPALGCFAHGCGVATTGQGQDSSGCDALWAKLGHKHPPFTLKTRGVILEEGAKTPLTPIPLEMGPQGLL